MTFLVNYDFSFRDRLLSDNVAMHRVRRRGGIPVCLAGVSYRPTNMFSNGVIMDVHPLPHSRVMGTIGVASSVPHMRNAPVRVNRPRRVNVDSVGGPSFNSTIAMGPNRAPMF